MDETYIFSLCYLCYLCYLLPICCRFIASPLLVYCWSIACVCVPNVELDDGLLAGFEELRERHFGSILSVTRNGSVVAKNRRERENTEIKITKLPRSQTRRRQNLYALNL